MGNYKLIKTSTLNIIIAKMKDILNEMNELHEKYADKSSKEWLDGPEVCLLLNISPRSLQNYRDTGRIGFSKINNKIYYKVSSITKLLKENYHDINPNK